MNVTIRKAKNSEAEELTQQARRAKASWGYPEAWLREWEPHFKFSSDYIDSHSVLVARNGNTLVGAIAFEDSAFTRMRYWEIKNEKIQRSNGN
jgi:hypothetical protein